MCAQYGQLLHAFPTHDCRGLYNRVYLLATVLQAI